jgi:hypothetical protein
VAHLGLLLVGRTGAERLRRGSSAAPGTGHSGGGKFWRGRSEIEQRAAGEASTGSQGGAGWWDGDGMEGKATFTEQHLWWPAARHGAVGGAHAAGLAGGPILRSTRASSFATAGPTAACLGAGADLGRNTRPYGHGLDRRSVGRRPAGRRAAQGGNDFKGLSGRAGPRETRGTDA